MFSKVVKVLFWVSLQAGVSVMLQFVYQSMLHTAAVFTVADWHEEQILVW